MRPLPARAPAIGVALFLASVLLLAAPGPSSGSEILSYECPLAVTSPLYDVQAFDCPMPGNVTRIREVRLGLVGEFNGTIWLCNLETPDPFAGPGGVSVTVSAAGILELPSSHVDWTASPGAFDVELVIPPPAGEDWGFLAISETALIALDDYVPESWDCYERCPHGCANVSGFDLLSSARLIIEYETTVALSELSWGTLKAHW